MANQSVILLAGVGHSGNPMLHSHSEISFSVKTHFIKRYGIPLLLTVEKIKGGMLKDDKILHGFFTQKSGQK